jgi:hypothetical protein
LVSGEHQKFADHEPVGGEFPIMQPARGFGGRSALLPAAFTSKIFQPFLFL